MKKIVICVICVVFMLSLTVCAKEKDEIVEDVGDETKLEIVVVTAEKTAYNYLTGEYNMATDRAGTQPYCVLINNIREMPQVGLSQADIIIEIVTEGGITRFGALYTDTREIPKIGSVRSLRPQFIEAAFPANPIFIYTGTSIQADTLVVQKNLAVLDTNTYEDLILPSLPEDLTKEMPPTYTSGRRIYEHTEEYIAPSTGENTSFFNFEPSGNQVALNSGAATNILFPFSEHIVYNGDFRYDDATGKYLKYRENAPYTDDLENGESVPLSFTNVFVLFVHIQAIPGSAGLIEVNYQSGGTGYYFSNGQYESFSWTKESIDSEFVFTKSDGSVLEVNSGKSMMCIVNNTFESDLVIE